MTQFNNEVDSPPSEAVAARFSDELAAAIVVFHSDRHPDVVEAMRRALSDVTLEQIDEVLEQRREVIMEALGVLASEFPKLGEDLAFRQWRNDPTQIFKPMNLSASRRRPKALMRPSELLSDLAQVALSKTGFSQRDSPQAQPRLTIEDFAKRPRIKARDLEYQAGTPGYESPDSALRVLGGDAA